ncbi:hypothetical protein PYCCODRAFT_1411147 [Trametes coccinea BRFM310]|uniref:Fungal-type protein kinase domain-containing protein n=1 Tax=Trametes coccinea (strain BRFM310) TaxID=1353009 RepID=A0A1Y2IMA9_TRAC3|nr:hypothetical protein PYCCODRAFT_1411147 [Trametes coccinea BRFM310]
MLFRPGAPTEEAIADTFINVLNTKEHGGLLHKHNAAFTGNRASRDGCNAKVNAGIYPRDHTPAAGNPDWTHIRMFIEFKRKGTHLDPFDDADPNTPEANAQSRVAVRNQILDYARVVNEYQHRICTFGLFVIGPEYRLMRFDHSGIVATKKGDYTENPRPLLSFLAWFDSLDGEHQGLDPTATLLKKGSRAYRLMTEFALKNKSDMRHNEGHSVAATAPKADALEISLNRDFRQSLKHDWPRYKLEIGEGSQKRIFLVGKPVWTAFWLFGRGTRGYVALDVKTRRFVFLKDCWRPFYEGVEPEGNYLNLLNKEALVEPHICVPTVVAHGDVAKQRTFTASYAQKRAAEAKEAIRALYAHYRIVFKDVCLPFTAVRSSKQLVKCLYQCIMTHSLAYTKLRLLHRDISAGNVIILPALSKTVNAEGKKTVTWTGMLTDWELAKFVPEPDASGKLRETPRQPERTGTWQFMSVAYIRNHPRQPVSVADELESFFHVLLFYAVRLLRHNVQDVRFFLSEYFDSFTVVDGVRRDCSTAKSTAMHTGAVRPAGGGVLKFTGADTSVDHINLNNLFSRLLRCFQARYAILAWEQQQTQTHRPEPPRPKPPASIPSTTSGDLARPPPGDSDDEDDFLSTPNLEPTQIDRKIAKYLDNHVKILNVFWQELQHEGWPENDVLEDRLPDNYDPRELILALERMCAASFMRTMDEDAEDAPPRKRPRTGASEPTASTSSMLPPEALASSTSFGNSIRTQRGGDNH